MKHISLYFQVHQPYRLKHYRFFDIGQDDQYFDHFTNKRIIERISENAYLPTNQILKELIEKHGDKFKVNFSLSGTVLQQFKDYKPEVIESFQELAKTGNVEFLAETYSHSLVSLKNKEIFIKQVKAHSALIQELFNQKPKIFRNTELIYDNQIGADIAQMGFKAMLTEGAKHILGWKSPNKLYYNVINPEMKLILRNYKLSDDIAFRFSDQNWDKYPLDTETYTQWLKTICEKEQFVNIFMDYETFGEHQKAETGIFEFLKKLPETVFKNTDLQFAKLSEIASNYQAVAPMSVIHPISWADQERDITAWQGNEMQEEALDKLYCLSKKMQRIKDPKLQSDWRNLQASDHFYYMSTKINSDGLIHDYFNPYETPFNAFINYMNVISDFTLRVNKHFEAIVPNDKQVIKDKIEKYDKKIKMLQKKLDELE